MRGKGRLHKVSRENLNIFSESKELSVSDKWAHVHFGNNIVNILLAIKLGVAIASFIKKRANNRVKDNVLRSALGSSLLLH